MTQLLDSYNDKLQQDFVPQAGCYTAQVAQLEVGWTVNRAIWV